mgnify:CR=1 FL=1
MDFTAIDFETATSAYTSACSLGLCVVENNVIKERKEIFIKPYPFEFNDFNIKIHGITPKMVRDMPRFNGYWDEIRPYIEHRMVIAHNASFDVRVLCKTLEHYGISLPDFDYMCTVKLSQKAYPELESHRLNRLCGALGIEFDHHHAYDDAYACAMAFLRMAYDYSLYTFDEIEECFDVKRGHIDKGSILKPVKHSRRKKTKKAG